MLFNRRHPSIDRSRYVKLRLEELEIRAVPSTTPWQATPTLTVVPLSGPASNSGGYSPSQLAQLYGFGQVNFGGSGQTIAIVDAYDDPNISSDLIQFDKTYNLPGQTASSLASFFNKVGQSGSTTSLPSSDGGWSLEISLDVEWAHAMAPQANILLVEANSAEETDLIAAVNTARNSKGVSVVSMSFGGSEFSTEASVDSTFTTPAGHIGVTFVAAAGDNGAGTEWPAVSPNVLAVGGTTLPSNGQETAWAESGGGYSKYEPRPSYQTGFTTNSKRAQPDVAYDANPSTGVNVYDSYGSNDGWNVVGGTSAGAAQWSALIADANQARVSAGIGTISNAETAIYGLPTSDFNQITSGSNGRYQATAGYNLVTGRGSPKANLIIDNLANISTTGGGGSGGTTGSGGGTGGSSGSGSGSGTGGGTGSGTGFGGGFGTGIGGFPTRFGGRFGSWFFGTGGSFWGAFLAVEAGAPDATTTVAQFASVLTKSTSTLSASTLSQGIAGLPSANPFSSTSANLPLLSSLANVSAPLASSGSADMVPFDDTGILPPDDSDAN